MSKSRRKRHRSPSDWENLSDDEILQIRIRDLGLQIHQSPLEEHIQRLARMGCEIVRTLYEYDQQKSK